MDIKAIHNRIDELCKERNWSYYKLAKEAGFQQSTLKPIIKEKNMPSLYTLNKICMACDISLSDFFSSHYFNKNQDDHNELQYLLAALSPQDKKLVKIYIYGLLHKEIKEDF